jgi:hypothetical protein
MIQAYENREAVEFLIQNVLTAVPLPGQIREQIIEDTLKGAVPAMPVALCVGGQGGALRLSRN